MPDIANAKELDVARAEFDKLVLHLQNQLTAAEFADFVEGTAHVFSLMRLIVHPPDVGAIVDILGDFEVCYYGPIDPFVLAQEVSAAIWNLYLAERNALQEKFGMKEE